MGRIKNISINKYGIIIKKRLEEKYPKKYQELKDKNELLSLIKEKQFDIIVYKSNLIENTKGILTKDKMSKIYDLINEKIISIVDNIGNS